MKPLVILCVPLLACSNSGGAPDASTDAPITDGPAADVIADAGSLPQMLLSSGNFDNLTVDGGTPGANLVLRNFDVAPSARCGVVKTGACWVQDCRVPDGGSASTPPTVLAGALTLSKGTTTLITATPTAGGPYQGITTTSWIAGDTLTFAATGAAIPAFTQALTAPPTITITAPTYDAGIVTLSHTSALVVSWQATTAPSVIIGLEEVLPLSAPDDLHVICEYGAASGSGTVPASIMGMFDLGLSPNSFALNIGGASLSDITAGGYPIHAYLVNATTLEVQLQ